MGYFMINATAGHAHIDLPSNWQSNEHKGQIAFRNINRNPRIKIEDEFISFKDNDHFSFISEKHILTTKGIISSIKTVEDNKLSDYERKVNEARANKKLPKLKYFNHEVEFKKGIPFTDYKYLDDYSYSLIKIYKRFIKPARHFSRSVTELPKIDYETLDKERIFVQRTMFGRLINALPYPNRLQFLLFAIETFNSPDLREVQLSRAFPFLKDFVGSGVIKMGHYLIKSQEMINNLKLFDQEFEVGFENNLTIEGSLNKLTGETNIDYINDQVYLFNQVFSISNNFEKLFSMDDINPVDTSVFEIAFRRRSWPVDLNTDNL